MNHAFAISQRRIQRIEQARTPLNKRTTTFLRLAALLGRASINDGNGIASLGAVPAVRSANAVTHSPNDGEQRP